MQGAGTRSVFRPKGLCRLNPVGCKEQKRLQVSLKGGGRLYKDTGVSWKAKGRWHQEKGEAQKKKALWKSVPLFPLEDQSLVLLCACVSSRGAQPIPRIHPLPGEDQPELTGSQSQFQSPEEKI